MFSSFFISLLGAGFLATSAVVGVLISILKEHSAQKSIIQGEYKVKKQGAQNVKELEKLNEEEHKELIKLDSQSLKKMATVLQEDKHLNKDKTMMGYAIGMIRNACGLASCLQEKIFKKEMTTKEGQETFNFIASNCIEEFKNNCPSLFINGVKKKEINYYK